MVLHDDHPSLLSCLDFKFKKDMLVLDKVDKYWCLDVEEMLVLDKVD